MKTLLFDNTETMTAQEVYDMLWAIEGKNHPEGQEFDVDCDEQHVEALMNKGCIAEGAWAIVEIWNTTVNDGGRVEDFIKEYNDLTNQNLDI